MKFTTRTAIITLGASALLAGCNNEPEYKVTGTNANEISQYNQQRESAAAYLTKVQAYVAEIKAMEALPVGPALPAQHQKMQALKVEGDGVGSIVSPLSHCRASGYAASEYWQTVAGMITTQPPSAALERFASEVQQCQQQLQNPPKAITYIEGPADKQPAYPGCLEILALGEKDGDTRTWSCPTESMPST
ncbi:hypothetical protein LOY37_10195 [Pseudomonas sp. B21-012]|uniref:hypothetical protein n=1 Tax=unclassified Pseudomonas TaxID=196821 RepID=UPI00087E9378|nr:MULTISPECIES: hypothetical protein [unclassified Pseudomonas]QVM94866.1 hypothetical protein JYG36_17265 [Pseudomonas sp. SORT22]UVL58266.1 hypothetical protein LOY22_10010 [Pseudomonas sp. B21-035]UVM57916.1 hypothetical protein LOY37_10195 [Pseudomonas sp. B21-012]SDQ81260.1 hypothetical protein SAMN05216487_4035 [Pseudomonas sp. UC 17F4]